MKYRFFKTVAGLGLGIALVICGMSQKASSDQGGGGRLEGTWNVVLTLRNCQTGDEIRHFPELTTFMFGGTMLDSTAGIPQSLKTPGQGIWSHESDNTYSFAFKTLNFNAAGAFVGSTRISHTLTLDSDADSYTSSGTAQVFDANGNPIGGGCSTSVATRLE